LALDLHLDDVLTLKKRHPCGSDKWLVYRLSGDIGLECLGCQRRTMMPRSQLERRVTALEPRARPDADTSKA